MLFSQVRNIPERINQNLYYWAEITTQHTQTFNIEHPREDKPNLSWDNETTVVWLTQWDLFTTYYASMFTKMNAPIGILGLEIENKKLNNEDAALTRLSLSLSYDYGFTE